MGYYKSQTVIFFAVAVILFKGTSTSSVSKYSKEEISALKKFRPLVENVLVHDYQRTDSFLMRWLRARQLNPNTAATMLRAAQRWRKTHRIDSILNERNTLVEEIVDSMNGVDKQGAPVLTVESGKLDLRKILIEGKKSLLLRANFQIWERMAIKAYEISNRTGIDNSQVIFLGDFAGFNVKQHMCIPCITFSQDWVRYLEDYYPGFRKWDILINVPKSYELLFKNTAALLSPETKAVIRTFGQNRTEWSLFLDTIIDRGQRSYRFGGTKIV